MSETPFRVVDINDMWKVVGPTNRPIFEHPLEWISTNRCDLANAAWTTANGPELTRQRDEAVELLRECGAMLDAAMAFGLLPANDARTDLQARIDAAIRRGEVK
jgi:hypothetical protein